MFLCDRGNLDDEMEDAHSFPPASRHPLHGAPRFFGSGTWGGGACAQAGGVAGGAGQQAAVAALAKVAGLTPEACRADLGGVPRALVLRAA